MSILWKRLVRFLLKLRWPLLLRFIEHGEYKENQYGTSIEAIRSVQAKNKMCVVDVQPEVGPMSHPPSPLCLIHVQMRHSPQS